MFNFEDANESQRIAISSVDCPLLITAGPGTGKTYTLVQRAVYLIQEIGVKPEQIMIATFTEKAAKELITRITNALMDRNISININEMYIGTFHSICLRFIKEHLEYTHIRKNYRLIDSFDQQYFVFQNIYRFRQIENFEVVINETGAWRQAKAISDCVNILCEELIQSEMLEQDEDICISTVGKIIECYLSLLSDNNLIDFSSIQTEAFRLLKNNPAILKSIQNQIKYIMIDEYQDTNYIQEQLVFLLAGENKNVCVVGDDDQGLYRFRGATIRNILEFPNKFENGQCKIVALTINYRSDSKIIDFYNKWMLTTSGEKFKFVWGQFRFDKKIVPFETSKIGSSTVIKVFGDNDIDDWHNSVLNFIHTLQNSGKLQNLNQIAFLFNSVKNPKAVSLANYLENNGINVYSPRSDMFFERNEIMLSLGCLLLVFPSYLEKLDNRDFQFLSDGLNDYYVKCIELASSIISENPPLFRWIQSKGRVHSSLTQNTDYGISGLLYQMFEFSPFAQILDVELENGIMDLRPTRNMALFSQILAKYEYLHRANIFTVNKIDEVVEKFFNMYLQFLFVGGISEYEDDSEYAPSGCVSFLTIHQSKGMEFPVVCVGSLDAVPRGRNAALISSITEKYSNRDEFEPADQIKYFDFWRQYYTAFSRAQDLLVLTCNEVTEKRRQPSKYFAEHYKNLISYDNPIFDINEFDLKEVKEVNLKETYSFTSHISVYETCSLQYKFYKELGFTPVRIGATVFGMLVHQTIEDIHRTAIRKEELNITPENIQEWFASNYLTISKSEHTYLAQSQLDAALRQILNYADRQKGDWSNIQEAEVEVGLVKPDYILQGTIDLIRGENNTVEIVDFKSEKKPDLIADRERVEHYKKQLQIYAHLIEEKTGKTVSKMHLYYTGSENGVPTITFLKKKESIESTIQEFEDIVHKIQSKNFTTKSKSQVTCDNCDFRHYCSN